MIRISMSAALVCLLATSVTADVPRSFDVAQSRLAGSEESLSDKLTSGKLRTGTHQCGEGK